MADEKADAAVADPTRAKDPANGAVSKAKKHPPPEKVHSLWMRRYIMLSLWAIVILLGLPIWIWTTSVHRSSLPLDAMHKWANGQACQLEFPLHVAVESDSLRAQDVQQLVRLVQQTLDDHDVPSLHHIRIGTPDLDKSPAVTVQLRSSTDRQTANSTLLRYEPVLRVHHAPFSAAPHASTLLPLARYISSELRSLYDHEHAMLAHLLTQSGRTIPQAKPSPKDTDLLNQRSMRTFRYAPTYHLTFSLFSGGSAPATWHIEPAIEDFLRPLLSSFSAVSTFTIDSQVQFYASLPSSMNGPHFDEASRSWYLDRPDLSSFINAAEWPLNPGIGTAPTINFVVYVPSEQERPLLLRDSPGTSWLIPQWGGVQIINPGPHQQHMDSLTKQDLQPIMHVFAEQLVTLLGLPKSPASLPLQLGSLTRERAASVMLSASSTLGALSRLTLKLTSIAIPDKVAVSVDKTLSHLDQACQDLRNANYESALDHARIAENEAEEAFFEPSMVGQVYFPDEHKVAVYVPLLGPMAVPLFMSLAKEVKRLRRTWSNKI